MFRLSDMCSLLRASIGSDAPVRFECPTSAACDETVNQIPGI